MSRGRPRTRSRRVLPLTLVLLAVLLAGVSILPAASFSNGDVGRSASIGVTDDPAAILGIDAAGGVEIDSVDQLVIVTNGLESTAVIEVALTDESATKVDLVVNGTSVGDSYRVELARSESVAIDVAVPNDDSYVGDVIEFDVSADGAVIDATAANRTVPIEDSSA